MLVGRGRPFGDMLDETSLKFPFQYLYFVIEECPGAFADKQPDDGRTQIGYLFIGVAHNLERIEDVRLTFVGKVGLSGNIWLVSFKISYLCLPLFYETRTTPSCHPSGCAYRQL